MLLLFTVVDELVVTTVSSLALPVSCPRSKQGARRTFMVTAIAMPVSKEQRVRCVALSRCKKTMAAVADMHADVFCERDCSSRFCRLPKTDISSVSRRFFGSTERPHLCNTPKVTNRSKICVRCSPRKISVRASTTATTPLWIRLLSPVTIDSQQVAVSRTWDVTATGAATFPFATFCMARGASFRRWSRGDVQAPNCVFTGWWTSDKVNEGIEKAKRHKACIDVSDAVGDPCTADSESIAKSSER